MIEGIIGYYFITTVMNAIIFTATFALLIRKYYKKKNKLHFWAAIAFSFLVVQEMISAYWIVDSVMGGIALASRPWQLQSVAVLFAFMMLGLAMTGKIKD